MKELQDRLQESLRTLIGCNYLVFFKAQAGHHNVIGPDFPTAHALLGEVYDVAYKQHDILSEALRTYHCPAVSALGEMISRAAKEGIKPSIDSLNRSVPIYKLIYTDIETILDLAQDAYEQSSIAELGGVETVLGDYLAEMQKLCWKIRSTLE